MAVWRLDGRLSLASRFMISSLLILVVGMAGVGVWVARQIEIGVVQRTAATTALYVDSLVTPALQSLAAPGFDLPAADAARLDQLFRDTPLGQEVAAFRVWDRDRQVVYSTIPGLVGHRVAAATPNS